MKKIFLYFVKFICILLIFIFVFSKLSTIILCWGKKEAGPDRNSTLFFSLPPNSIDVLFLGTSHVYCSYIPSQIKDETGIQSAILATSSQSCQNSYWLLREALKKQKPKVVVIDMHAITSSVDEDVSSFYLHYTSGISIMPDTSITKLKAFWDIQKNCCKLDEKLSIYDTYAFWEFRNDLTRDYNKRELWNLLFNPISEYQNFGFLDSFEVYPMEQLLPCSTSDKFVDLKTTIDFKYLEKIYELTNKEDITLLLVRAPYNYDLDDCHLFEQTFSWAEENSIPTIDYFTLMDETQIDLDTDFQDEDHLNTYGAKKATHYIGPYIKQLIDSKY